MWKTTSGPTEVQKPRPTTVGFQHSFTKGAKRVIHVTHMAQSLT